MDWFNEIVVGKELDAARRERKKEFIYETVVIEAKERYIAEGWVLDKELVNGRIKLKKPKSADERFENRVWLMLYALGFSEMNKTRNFKIEYEKNGEKSSKQIDILAIDEETILVIECKCAQTSGKPYNFKKDIEAIVGYRASVFGELEKKYPNRKMVCLFVTYNYEISPANLEALKNHGIQYLNEDAIEYYEILGKDLGKAARFQLLGNLFAGKKIQGMETTVAAIKGTMGGKVFYSFAIEPSKLLKMAYILHRNNAQPEEVLPAYQRLIKKSRLKQITDFVNGGGFFPNSIIVSISNTKPTFDLAPKNNQPKDSSSRIGLLTLPQEYRSIFIIDGQHRLYGYADSEYAEKDLVPVVAFYDLENNEQIELFMQINEKQKAVSRTLRTTLNADLLWTASNMADQQKALRSRVAQNLGENKKSPLFGRIIIGENQKKPERNITLTFIDMAISKAGYLGIYKENILESDGLFEYNNIDLSYKKILDYLIQCFDYIQRTVPGEWEKTSNTGAVFTSNVGVYSLIIIFADILKCLQDQRDIDIKKTDTKVLSNEGESYLLALIDYIEPLDIEKREEFTKKYGSGAQKQCLNKFRQIIHDQYKEFCPEGLMDWIRDSNQQYNEDSIKKIRSIENKLVGDFRMILKEGYGDEWLRKGLDRPVFNNLNSRASDYEYDTGEKRLDPWDGATLEDCEKVATWSRNWSELFKGYFDNLFDDGKSHNKSNATSWMNNLHKINKNLQVDRNYSVSHEQYKQIIYYYDLIAALPDHCT